MPQLRLALAQVNPRVGDLDGNAELVLAAARDAAAAGAHLLVLPEMPPTVPPPCASLNASPAFHASKNSFSSQTVHEM